MKSKTHPALDARSVSPELAGARRLTSGAPRRVLLLAARFEAETVDLHLAMARTGLRITLVSTHPIPPGQDAPPVPELLKLIVADLGHLPDGLGVYDAVVVADRIEVPAALPVAWLRALADRGYLLVPLRGLGLLSARTCGAGRAAGYLRHDPDQGVIDVPDDIEPGALTQLRAHPGTPLPAGPAQSPARLPAQLLDQALPWLKFQLPHLMHHREQHGDGATTWHFLVQGTGVWVRAHFPAAEPAAQAPTVMPTVTQGQDTGLWERVVSWAQEWAWCMDPVCGWEARVLIDEDGTLTIAPVG